MFDTSHLPAEVRFREVCRRWLAHYGQPHLPTPAPDPAEPLLKLVFGGTWPLPDALRAWQRLGRSYPARNLGQAPDAWLATAALPPPTLRALAQHLYCPEGQQHLAELPHLSPDAARAWALALPGVTPAVADRWLLWQFRQPLLPADPVAERIWQRLGWQANVLAEWLNPTAAARFAFWQQTQWHAQRVCTARQPACGRCSVADLCPWLAAHPF